MERPTKEVLLSAASDWYSNDLPNEFSSARSRRIEPLRLEEIPSALGDLIAEISAQSAVLGAALHPRTAANLADLVRIMNTYYSNLIEGNNTKPLDIQRALEGKLDKDKERRNHGLLASDTPKGNLYLRFPASALDRVFPKLYPET